MPAEAIDLGDLPAHGPRADDGGFEDEHRPEATKRTARSRPSRPLAASVPPMSRPAAARAGPAHRRAVGAGGRAAAVRPARQQSGVLRRARLAAGGDRGVRAAGHVRGAAGGCSPPNGWRPGRARRLAWVLHLVFVARSRRRSRSRRSRWRHRCPALALALALGVAAAVAYVRLPAARTLLTVLGPGAARVPGPVPALLRRRRTWSSPAAADVQAAHVRATAPVVLVIFDEFPVHSLMGAGRAHRRAALPQLRPARRATRPGTATPPRSIRTRPTRCPAILDGRLPRQERLPVAADHPQQHLQPARRPLRAARARGRDGRCARRRLCAPASASDVLALGRRRRAPTRHELLPDDVEDELPSVEPGRLDEGGPRTRDTSVAAREQAPPLRAAARQPRPRPPGPLRGSSWHGDRGRPAPAAAPDPHPAAARAVSSTCPRARVYRRSPKEALPGIDGRPGYGSRVRRRAGLPAPPAPGPGDRPAARRAARPPARGRHLRPRRRRRGGRSRHELPARPRPAPACAPATSRTSPRCPSS